MDQENRSGPRKWWSAHSDAVLRIAVFLMFFCAVAWLTYEFWRLLWHQGEMGAIDLKQRHDEVARWFSGKQVYGVMPMATYPPATYITLWPMVGWLNITGARWLWGVTTLASLGWLAWLFIKESRADATLEKLFITLIPFAMYATGATIGNGQLIVHVMPFLLTGLLLLKYKPITWRNDIIASLSIIVALMKPSISVPFFFLVVFVSGRLRPALLVCCGYVSLTYFSVSFQEKGLVALLVDWMTNASSVLIHDATEYSVSNLHSWFFFWGLEKWLTPSSLTVLFALGVWIFFNRQKDIWIIIGVTAIIARFWTYHSWKDDLLIALPMITLFRIAKLKGSEKKYNDLFAVTLLGLSLLSTVAPGGLYLFPSPWKQVYVAGQVFIWISVFIYLLCNGQRR
jgi:hypothetical protein